MNPYETFAQLAAREAELVAEERWDEVVELGRLRAELIAHLPASPPPDASDSLEQAWRTMLATAGALSDSVAETRAQLRRFQDAHRAIEGYTRTARPLRAA
jgi:hypothetical protein